MVKCLLLEHKNLSSHLQDSCEGQAQKCIPAALALGGSGEEMSRSPELAGKLV